MARLYEEMFTRMEEMAMITTRALRVSARAEYAVRFLPFPVEGKEPATVEIVSTGSLSACYDYRAGACFFKEREKDSSQKEDR